MIDPIIPGKADDGLSAIQGNAFFSLSRIPGGLGGSGGFGVKPPVAGIGCGVATALDKFWISAPMPIAVTTYTIVIPRLRKRYFIFSLNVNSRPLTFFKTITESSILSLTTLCSGNTGVLIPSSDKQM